MKPFHFFHYFSLSILFVAYATPSLSSAMTAREREADRLLKNITEQQELLKTARQFGGTSAEIQTIQKNLQEAEREFAALLEQPVHREIAPRSLPPVAPVAFHVASSEAERKRQGQDIPRLLALIERRKGLKEEADRRGDMLAALGVYTAVPITMPNANLDGIQARGADLRNAKLPGAQARKANFYNANFRLADLSSVDFTGADLSQWQEPRMGGSASGNEALAKTNLTGATLTGANLTNINFYQANLTGAVVTGANFTGARFDEAKGLNTMIGLTEAQIEQAASWPGRKPSMQSASVELSSKPYDRYEGRGYLWDEEESGY